LHTKLLSPVNTLIADFLAKAPDPPAFLLTRNAVHILKVAIMSILHQSQPRLWPAATHIDGHLGGHTDGF